MASPSSAPWFHIGMDMPPQRQMLLSTLSFALPILLWALVSYVPFLWHPLVEITEPGDSLYFDAGERVEREAFERENRRLRTEGLSLAEGTPSNPVFLPAPHVVATAMYTAFKTEPRRTGDNWLHESLLHSISIIAWAFFLSTIIGVPLGVLCGTFGIFSRLFEPFIEFFRYLPAPVFGALAVAVLGINDAPKIAIVFIGTFFQMILVIANTTRKVDPGLLEAAQTLGAKKPQLVFKVVIPAAVTDIYNDLRILLGWAWTYLIVAEMIGRSSGITFFINQQARYRNYENVFAAIILIGIIGLTTDLFLNWLGKRLFPWKTGKSSKLAFFIGCMLGPREKSFFTR